MQNHIEGGRLTHDQTRYIFEMNTIGLADQAVDVDDVVEPANHFRCIDMNIGGAASRESPSAAPSMFAYVDLPAALLLRRIILTGETQPVAAAYNISFYFANSSGQSSSSPSEARRFFPSK